VDDVHACISTITEQFRIKLPNTHPAYAVILKEVANDLRRQSPSRFLDLDAGDPREAMEVPFWSWKNHQDAILAALNGSKETLELLFSYPLLRDVLPYCRCIITGQFLEIEPICPPTDLLRSFSKAKRRIYMTGTLADDSVLITHLGAGADSLGNPIVPTSSQSMGERMILMPQELNADIDIAEIRKLLVRLAKQHNVVIIVPSKPAAASWENVADQILIGDQVVSGVAQLRRGHVGLTVLVNRYDGIDLPEDACRVLAIFDLPEVSSLREAADMAVLGDSTAALRRQMQRIEQGMGRGVRSNDDHCVVLLCGARLVSRLKSPEGRSMLSGATQAQLELSTNLAKQLAGTDIEGIAEVIDRCLARDDSWVRVSKRALLKAVPQKGLSVDPASVATRQSFDLCRMGDHPGALAALRSAMPALKDEDSKALLLVRQAEVQQHLDPVDAQKTLLAAYKINRSVIKPLDGVAYQKLTPAANQQAAAVQTIHRRRFLEAADRVLYTKALLDDLVFKPNTSNKFESAFHELGLLLGLGAQRPEKDYGIGPDNLWAFANGDYLVVECKNGATSDKGISKHDLGQLGQAIDWFEEKYTSSVSKTPVMIHPLHNIGPGAAMLEGTRVINEKCLAKLRASAEEFMKSLGDMNVLNDTKSIAQLLAAHNFTAAPFLSTYSVKLKV
jgi:hypothetical protein